MHLKDGELREYEEGLSSPQVSQRVGNHLASCAECAARSRQLSARAESVSGLVGLLSPSPGQIRSARSTAQSRLEGMLSAGEGRRKEEAMLRRLMSGRDRTVWAAALVILILAIAMTIPSVRAAAVSFLGLFRIEQIQVVEVNPANLPEQLGSSSSMERLLAQDVQVEEMGESQVVTSAREAGDQAGFPVRLPTAAQGALQLRVQSSSRVTFHADIQRLRQILIEVGQADIQLPDSLDQAEVVLEVPSSVQAGYGQCDLSGKEGDQGERALERQFDCTILVQMPSPTITAPPELDIAAIGQAFLQVMGMSESEARRFSENVDWATTLVVPIPRYGVTSQDVQVDGVQGTLFQQTLEEHAPNFMLMWVKGGIVYVLTGEGTPERAFRIADSLK